MNERSENEKQGREMERIIGKDVGREDRVKQVKDRREGYKKGCRKKRVQHGSDGKRNRGKRREDGGKDDRWGEIKKNE